MLPRSNEGGSRYAVPNIGPYNHQPLLRTKEKAVVQTARNINKSRILQELTVDMLKAILHKPRHRAYYEARICHTTLLPTVVLSLSSLALQKSTSNKTCVLRCHYDGVCGKWSRHPARPIPINKGRDPGIP